MEPTTAAARRPRKTPVKTLLLRSTHKLLPDITVAIARNRCTYLLVIPNPDPDQPNCCATYATLSLLVAENPFPGYSVQGNEMVWLKTYSENEGMAQQLAAAGWLRLYVLLIPFSDTNVSSLIRILERLAQNWSND